MHPNGYPQRSSAAGRNFSTPSQRAAATSSAHPYGQPHPSAPPPNQAYLPPPSLSNGPSSSQTYYPSRNGRSAYPSMDRASSTSPTEGPGPARHPGEPSSHPSQRHQYASRYAPRNGGRYGYGPDHHRYIPSQGPPSSSRSTGEEGPYGPHPLGHSPSAPMASSSSSSSSMDRQRRSYHSVSGEEMSEGIPPAQSMGHLSPPSLPPPTLVGSHDTFSSSMPRASSGKGPGRSGHSSSSYSHPNHGSSSQRTGWRQGPGTHPSMAHGPSSLPPIDPDVGISMPSWTQGKDREEGLSLEERRIAEKEEVRIHAEYRKARFNRESTEREVWRWERQLELTNMQLDMLG
ncbi:hypothetical protein BJ684DRAFT_16054 [Piptocephalis cylindrospora]|uniref:Uncharacterized protein n=1 Tax=Piptocephalis cylindrospora TaxID=1907219 RepID=A0A4P9Y3P9_9FUNG|nr:hypothetical protein BJ684DRAFT_16054 [Piptocephalis cylindrospora]|eukprot:RKP13556.1 hypothetical protein BJ684DRAFT_16054 [Piptocephalis cylindrospora]